MGNPSASTTNVLSINGAQLIGAFKGILDAEPGLKPESVVTFTLNPPYYERTRRQRFYKSILADVRRVPGVRVVGAADWLPPDDPFGEGSNYQDADMPADSSNTSARGFVPFRIVTPGYFEALGTGMKEGREYCEADRADSAVVVNAAFAQ